MRIKTIHQIEVSSRCNLACRYCPHPKLSRDKTDMSKDTFVRAIDWAVAFNSPELSFTGMGEALLHPDIYEMLGYARLRLPNAWLLMATNGIALVKGDQERIDRIISALVELDVSVYVSVHRPEMAGPAVERLGRAGVKVGLNGAFIDSGFNWAGQVEWHGNPAPRTVCKYLLEGWGTVLVNGDIVNCCMDAHGLYPFYNVHKPIRDDLLIKPIPLCGQCHLKVPEEK